MMAISPQNAIVLLLTLASSVLHATIVDVYVYNTEFSVNPPGNPVVQAVITQGDSIRWLWVQGGHTTTAVAGSSEQWNQPINSSNTSFTRQFNSIGVFWYYCIPHGNDNGDGTASGMSGTITVLPAGSGACCLPDGNCVTSNEGGCISQNGYFSGPGTLCDTTSCEVTVELSAVRDNILYESATGALSNALGNHLYTGNNNSGRRRTVIAFDLTSIPLAAEIDSVQLKLFCNSSSGAAIPITIQKLYQNWGEGTSQAGGNEGNGASSTTGDATWIHTFYNTGTWTTAGGNFSPVVSASTDVGGQNNFYSWASSQLKADVTGWINQPSTNNGWILRGDENSSSNTKRFSSRQNSTEANRPKLIINYTIPPSGGCCLPDGACDTLTSTQCAAASGEFLGNGIFCGESSCSVQLTPFIDPLPLPAIALPQSGTSGGSAHYRIRMTEQFQQLHSELPPTRVWGYEGSYPGPTIEAFRDSLITVRWINNLREFESGELRTVHALNVDTCLHGPDMTGEVPVTVVHLHGGKVPHDSDGYPEYTFAPGDSSSIYTYPNIQPAATIWYHDHALGITRLNVMMGLAGFYIIRDSHEVSLNLPAGEYEIPLVIQDRSFNPDGSLRYHPMWEDHYFGDVILVNGKVWPYLSVKKGKYRFRLLNGSNSRAYTLSLSDSSTFMLIASELGLLEEPVVLDSLTLLPGERYDVVIDFSSYATGEEIVLKNSAPAPFPGFPGVGVIPDVMKFIVLAGSGFTDTIPQNLAVVEELDTSDAEMNREFELMTMLDTTCGSQAYSMWTINGLHWDEVREMPVAGSTEIWSWINHSGIAHPMHLHLVGFQILDRQALNEVTGLPEGPLLPPGPGEKGWKDTANSPTGYKTRIITRFDGFTGKYPYHCHILEHEDHEMMRQFEVFPCHVVTNTGDAGPGSLAYAIDCAQDGDTITFSDYVEEDTIFLNQTISLTKDLIFLNTNEVFISGENISQAITIEPGSETTFINMKIISGSGLTGRAVSNFGTLTLDNVSIIEHPTHPVSGSVILNGGVLILKNYSQLLF